MQSSSTFQLATWTYDDYTMSCNKKAHQGEDEADLDQDNNNDYDGEEEHDTDSDHLEDCLERRHFQKRLAWHRYKYE